MCGGHTLTGLLSNNIQDKIGWMLSAVEFTALGFLRAQSLEASGREKAVTKNRRYSKEQNVLTKTLGFQDRRVVQSNMKQKGVKRSQLFHRTLP